MKDENDKRGKKIIYIYFSTHPSTSSFNLFFKLNLIILLVGVIIFKLKGCLVIGYSFIVM